MSVYNSWGGKPGVYRDNFQTSAPVEGTPKPACYASEPMHIRTRKGEIVYRGVYFRKAKKHCVDIIGEPVSFSGTSREDVEDKVSAWVESGIDVDCARRKHQHRKNTRMIF
jgi:hypothetical protein